MINYPAKVLEGEYYEKSAQDKNFSAQYFFEAL